MSFESASLRTCCLLVSLALAGSAQAGTKYYSVNGGGGQAQIGDGLPIPAQVQFSSMGGKNFTGGPIGTFTNFPPLLIPVNPNKSKALIKQTTTMAVQPDMTVPPGVFRRIPTKNGTAMGTPVPLTVGVAKNNPRVLQVRTTLSISAPAFKLTTAMGSKAPGTIMFATGQRANNTTTYNGTPVGSAVIYRTLGARFGGPAQTRLKNIGVAPVPNPLGKGVIGIWGHLAHTVPNPCKHPKFGGLDVNCFATKIPAYPGTLNAAGGPASNNQSTPGTPPAKPGMVALSVSGGGQIQKSTPTQATGNVNNMATSVGFPWTTGALTITQPAAISAPEVFHITGMDSRVKGVGTIQMVSSSLSKRLATGPNANRAWAEYQLPEPGAALGAAAALAVLGLCHGLTRRR